jgi:hypothetical protein
VFGRVGWPVSRAGSSVAGESPTTRTTSRTPPPALTATTATVTRTTSRKPPPARPSGARCALRSLRSLRCLRRPGRVEAGGPFQSRPAACTAGRRVWWFQTAAKSPNLPARAPGCSSMLASLAASAEVAPAPFLLVEPAGGPTAPWPGAHPERLAREWCATWGRAGPPLRAAIQAPGGIEGRAGSTHPGGSKHRRPTEGRPRSAATPGWSRARGLRRCLHRRRSREGARGLRRCLHRRRSREGARGLRRCSSRRGTSTVDSER